MNRYGLALLLALVSCGAASAEDLKVEDVIERHREAAGRIRTYDIRFRSTLQFVMRSKVERDERGRALKVKWVPLAEGEAGKRKEYLYREVYSDGKYRVERLDAKNGDTESVKILSGETETRYDLRRHRSRESPRQLLALNEGKNHRDYYEHAVFGTPVSYLLKLKDEVNATRDVGDPELILLDTPHGKIMSGHHIRVWLDESCGNLLTKVQTWKDGVLTRELKVTAREEIEPGVWAPVAGEFTSYTHLPDVDMKAFPTSILKYEVDLEHSHWNAPVDGDLFKGP